MVDLLISPGAPKPWLAHNKETRVLNSKFIFDTSSASPSPLLSISSTLKKYPLLKESLGSFLGASNSLIDSASIYPHPQSQSSSPRLTHKGRVSKRRIKNMSYPHYYSGYHGPSQESLGYMPDQLDHLPQTIMSPFHSDLKVAPAPAMKTTISSSSSDGEVSLEPFQPLIDENLLPISTSVGLACTTPTLSNGWESNHSFTSTNVDTPSLSSSFNLMDLPTDGLAVDYDTLLHTQRPINQDMGKPISLANYNQPLIHAPIPDWTWASKNTPEPWQQSYKQENTANNAGVTATDYLSNNWSHPKSMPPTNTGESATTQPYELLDTSYTNRNTIRSSSTQSSNEQDPELTGTAVFPQFQSPQAPNYFYSHHSTYTTDAPFSKALPQAPSNEDPAINASLHYTDTRNAFLIECKQRGLSYKDIKRIGGFKEAESTLRGRFRTLTKTKDQRVRKPKWLDTDTRLLCEAVNIFSKGTATSALYAMQPPKVSWKKVAQYIWAHGGSYQFGNATCKKKWCELHDINI